MKRIICLCLVIVCLFVLCGCKETSISEGALKYFSISEDGIDYIHALFEKYGGYFPCV